MKWVVLASAVVLGATILPGAPAQAAGCVKGAVVGGAAGHFLGHHGFIGALAGCAIGHHRAEKRERAREAAPQYGSSVPPRSVSSDR